MATLSQLRDEIATAIAGVAGHVQKRAQANPGFPLHLIGFPLEVGHDRTGGGIREYLIPVTTHVALNDVDDAQVELDQLATAVADALNANTSMIATIWTATTNNFRPDTVGNTKTIACDTIVNAVG